MTTEVWVFPASFAQQRMWFLDQLEPGNSFYNIPTAMRIEGPLNVAAIGRSLNEMVRRHESLRTSFATVDGNPAQVISKDGSLQVRVIALHDRPEAEREAEAMRLILSEAQQPFNLAEGPLLRALLLRLYEDEHIFLLTMHHIITDGWSLALLFEEMGALYDAFSKGKPSPLAELSLQYVDYSEWQREWIQGDVLEEQLGYWKQQMAGAPALLGLPTDRPRPPVQTFRGACQFMKIPDGVTEGLKSLSRQQGATLFMTLLAAFKTLLYRHMGQPDIVVGTPIANRNRAEVEGQIGLFANTLVLRTDLSGNPTFRELLGRVREVALGAYAHQDLPFEKLVEEMQPGRSLSHSPLFQVSFALEDNPNPYPKFSGLTVSRMEVLRETSKFDLTLFMFEKAEGLSCKFEYNTDLFDGATITRMMGHFQILLQGIAAHPQQSLSELPLVTEAERHQLLMEWNDTETEYPRDPCIHQLFEAQAERTPDAVAVVFEQEQLTYGELDRRANQLAHHLRALGVGPEALVGICMERSVEMVVGLVGILKAGGAYVPLDPSYPKQRLAFMLENAEVRVLLTLERFVDSLPEDKAGLVRLDSDWHEVAKCSGQNLPGEVKADNLAYVIYTSGSTGTPKGVQVPHRGLMNLVTWHQRTYDVAESDRATLIAAPGFDASVWELWPYLAAGASVSIVDETARGNVIKLVEWLRKNRVTISFLPTPMAEAVLAEPGVRELKLKALLTGGDRLHGGAGEASSLRLVNHYGPTENTVVTTSAEVAAGTEKGIMPPIGTPIANTQVYALDRHLRLAPVGVAGELCITGESLARGYLREPELTAEKFVPNPFGENPGSRLYRTGDLARRLPDGKIEYMGRNDYQVKIRGFRIELGEIEATLEQHRAVRQAIVEAREDISGQNRLVAYVVVAHKQPHTAGELRSFLDERLPEYMIPPTFVLLDELPLTPNGKIDRRALPSLDKARTDPDAAPIAARTPVEKALAEIWAGVLGLGEVGVCDNFFELGGDSILSSQIISRANQRGLRLTPKQIFRHQTIAELAVVAGTSAMIEAEQGIVIGTVPLTPIQHWFFEQNMPDPHHFNQAMMLEARRAIDPSYLERAVKHLLSHHDALRLRYLSGKSGWQQTNAVPGEDVPFSLVDLSGRPAAEQQAEIEHEAARLQTSLNLEEGQLVRVALFHLGAQKNDRLLIVIHHLAVDGVSWRILLEDLQAAYASLEQGGAVNLPRKTTSFKQWAERLGRYRQSQAFEQELEYWLNDERGSITRLPKDYSGGVTTVASSGTVSVSLSEQETRALLQQVPAAYGTQINDALLAALARAFARWTGQARLLVDLEGHGREEIIEGVDLSRTVGWFTAVFPMVLEVEIEATPLDALKSIQEQLRAVPNRGVGYGILKYLGEDDGVARKLRSLPQAEVSFNYLGQFDQMLTETSIFKPAQEPSGPCRSLRQGRTHLIGIDGMVAAGRLQFDWVHSPDAHRRSTIENLANQFIEELRLLMAHCQSADAASYSPSDFPDVDLSQEKLEKVFEEIGLAFGEGD